MDFRKYMPFISNLPNVIYIRWLDKEWFIKKFWTY
nr:MAG TPA: hypothetical protein [Bacteriophage sp.]